MPTQLPLLSIVIVSYNTASLLRCCLASLQAGTGGVAAEVIVVDNASTDGSAALVAAEFPAVTLITQQRNAGFAAANNAGLTRVRGAYLCLLNADTEVSPGTLTRLVGWLEQHPAAAVAAPRLLNLDGSTQATGFRFPGVWQVALDWFPLHPRLLVSRLNGRYPPPWPAPFRIDHPLGACFVVRRAAAAQVGLFDAGYFMYSEEVDWCRRLAAAGWEAWSLPDVAVVHHGGASTRQQPARMFEELHRSRDRYLRRWLAPAPYRLTRRVTRLGAVVEAGRTWQHRRVGKLSAGEARARIRACGRIFRGWPAHTPARIGRLNEDSGTGDRGAEERRGGGVEESGERPPNAEGSGIRVDRPAWGTTSAPASPPELGGWGGQNLDPRQIPEGHERPEPSSLPSPLSLTVVVLSLNEARHMRACLEAASVLGPAALLVLDSGSADATVAEARAAGAQVAQRPFDGYASQRNAALDLVATDWVYFVDADERVTPAQAAEVRARLLAEDLAGYWVPRDNRICGRPVRGGGWWPDEQLRLFRRAAGRYDPARQVHELVHLDGPAGHLAEPLIHFNYDNWRQVLAKQRRYTARAVRDALAAGQAVRPRNYLLQPLRAFHRRYLTLGGYRDGWLGVWLALLLAYYELLFYVWLGRARRQVTRDGPRR